MCKIKNTNVGIKKLDFKQRGKMAAWLTDGHEIIVPCHSFPISNTSQSRSVSHG